MLNALLWMVACMSAGAASHTCLLNESQLPFNVIPLKNVTHTTPTIHLVQRVNCDVCIPIRYRQLPEFTLSFGTDNPDTALLNQYRP
jgi:hypothetical protein